MDNWLKVKLSDVADIKLSNVDKKTKDNEKTIKLCNYTDVYKNSFISSDKAKNFMIASCNDNEYEKFLLQEGQVVITKDSETPDDIGISTYINENFDDVVLGYHLSLLTPNKEKLNGKFLNYWFYTKQIKKYFENNAGGSGQRCSLNLDIIKSIPLFLPQIEEQQKIASILFSLDKKIELNNKINQELEKMVKTLYDYWFVQFDFPDVNGKPYKSSGGEMVYNKELKREIPKEWEVVSLNKFCDYLEGPGITKDKYSEKGHKFINIKCIKNNDLDLSNASMIKEEYIDKYKHFLLKEKDILVSTSGTLGRLAIVRKEHIPLLLNTSIIRFRPKIENIFYYLYLYLKSEFFVNSLKKLATGSIQKNFGPTHLDKMCYFVPNIEIRRKFEQIVKPIIDKQILLKSENQKLAEIRDFLLPMLMNGQVEVK